ncbi:uncharacterized protein LW94_13126 [Fusarium fujikuroi]|nr:uncharacterized protein LW94_13126 [Fusarium fujikuroi]
MSASQSTVAAPAEGGPVDAVVARLMAETGASHVNFKISPAMPVNGNPGAPGAASSAGVSIDKLVADIKEKTGATTVRFRLVPNHLVNINDGMAAASKAKL